jgi:aminocarboxymuconate-semialdehyde decarboxylase
VTFDDQENPLLHYPGDYNIVVPGHRDISFREKVLEKAGIDKQILTFTSPGTHIETLERAVEFGKRINDIFADIIGKDSEKFSALSTLPLNDPEASVRELDRAVNELGFKGVMLFQ